MKLYIVRHGRAASDRDDSKRPLTDRGREETTRMAEFLKKKRVDVQNIFHSTKLRAKQTAEILLTAVDGGCPLIEKDYLSPNDSIDRILHEIKKQEASTMIVGHLPFVGHLVSDLLVGKERPESLRFTESSVAILEKNSLPHWELLTFLTPETI